MSDQPETLPEPDFDLHDVEEVRPARSKYKRPDAMTAVIGVAFDAAISKESRRRLKHGKGLAVILLVPTATWVVPITKYVQSVFGSRWSLHTRDGSDRRRNASVGSDEVSHDLSRGLCVLGIAADLGLLPAALTAAADITVRIAAPTGAVLRTAITRFAGRDPGEIPDGIAAGLDLHEILSAFRLGTGARKIAQRLAAASAGAGVLDRVPALETAVEYGEARVWGLNLARDIAAYRADRINWREVDRGICLHSAPGMGKSLFPKVLARACGVPLVTTSIGELFASGPGYLDSVIKNMRGAFARAAALASPCSILHIDEIDALPNRETLSERGRDWWTPVITDTLTLLDSTLTGRVGIVVVCSTNAIDRVDPALLRPGRLEKVVEIKRPDLAGTMNMLRFHLDGELAAYDLSEVGAMMEGSTGAEIMHAVRQARRTARYAGRRMAVDDIKSAVVPLEDIPQAKLFRMTVHEAAHAVVTLAIPVGTLKHVTIRTSGTSGGQTAVEFSEFGLATRQMIEDRVVVGLASRAAERLFTGAVSTGTGGSTSSDLGSATTFVAALHASFGMGDDLVYLGAGDDLLHELGANRELRERVERHLRELDVRATEIVNENREAILAVAERLAMKRYLRASEIEEIVRGVRKRTYGKTDES
ncbi:AAA family ATPase [Bradyrhizobium sp. B117]|uniref:AAA family ATPase n=1 Tax=Bradyrhizobium sp. B117 TaxID=3140246 RepID=UPI003183665F